MNIELRERRDQAAKRHNTALAQYPTREGIGFQNEMQAVVNELRAIASAADMPSSDPVEVARSYIWLGDAYFDLALGRTISLLASGAEAYDRAEHLLTDAEAPVVKAKLSFNYGNTLRGLSQGFDVGLLEAAQTRYESAARTFQSHRLPELAGMVTEQLQTIGPQLRLARKRAELERGQQRLQRLAARTKGADVIERDQIASELKELEQVRQRGSVAENLAEALAAAEEQVRRHPDRFADAAGKLDALKDSVAALKATLGGASPQPTTQGAGAWDQDLLSLLQARLQHETEKGIVSGDRARQLSELLQQLRDAMSGQDENLGGMSRKMDTLGHLTGQVLDMAEAPSWSGPAPQPGSRASSLVMLLDPLRRHLLAEKGRAMQPAEETAAATDLLIRRSKLEMRLREAAADEKRVNELEGEAWRLAAEVQVHARRHHLILAQPEFTMARSQAPPRSLFLSGGDELLRVAEALATRRDLTLFSEPQAGDYAQERWNQLGSSTVAVFDLRNATGKDLAQVCYELGLALALGKPSVVLANPGQEVPFDVDLQPVMLSGEKSVAQLDRAILVALASVVWGGAEAGLGRGPRDAIAWLDRRLGPRLFEGALGIARRMAGQHLDDAVAFRRTLSQCLGMLGADAPAVLLPAWPPAYPDPEDIPRCFHVMPFSQRWSNAVRDTARQICQEQGWRYSRGDEADEQRIIRGIWTEIARAGALLVDLTGNNANVALELGLAHALGRPCCLLAQGDAANHLFPSIAKLQVRPYQPDQLDRDLGLCVKLFLSSVGGGRIAANERGVQ